MDAAHDLAEQNSDAMRQEIDCTRSAMADKLEAMEERVMETVESARDTVQDSIQTAQDTVATVKRTFDVKHQVEHHPWAMVGGCFLAGLALSSLLPRGRQRSQQVPDWLAGQATASAGSPLVPAKRLANNGVCAAAPAACFPSTPSSRPGFFDRFQEEIDQVQGMAISYAMGLLRDSIKDSVPQLASQVDGVMNGITRKLGGEPAQQRGT